MKKGKIQLVPPTQKEMRVTAMSMVSFLPCVLTMLARACEAQTGRTAGEDMRRRKTSTNPEEEEREHSFDCYSLVSLEWFGGNGFQAEFTISSAHDRQRTHVRA